MLVSTSCLPDTALCYFAVLACGTHTTVLCCALPHPLYLRSIVMLVLVLVLASVVLGIPTAEKALRLASRFSAVPRRQPASRREPVNRTAALCTGIFYHLLGQNSFIIIAIQTQYNTTSINVNFQYQQPQPALWGGGPLHHTTLSDYDPLMKPAELNACIWLGPHLLPCGHRDTLHIRGWERQTLN